jgi:ABC-type transporter Mla subunit MlaD
MLTPRSPRHPLGYATALVVGATMFWSTAGTTLATDAGKVDPLTVDAAAATTSDMTLDELRAEVADLNQANQSLRAQNTSLQDVVDSVSAERDRMAKALARFGDLYDPLEADRQLLVELRKDMPSDRHEAESHLTRMTTLALAADPARLGQLVDKLRQAAPTWLDWRFGEYATTDAFSAAYVDSGANAFDGVMADFQSAVLLSTANYLDGMLTTLDRLR